MSHSVKIARAIALSMLLVVSTHCAAQVHDFCSFAGVWNSQGKNALTIHLSDNHPQCTLFRKTTSDIAIANNKIYIIFNVGKEIDGCVTIDTLRIFIGSIEEDVNTLRLTSHHIVKIHSKWRNEIKPIEKEDTIIFHKMSGLPCKSKVFPKGIGIEDTTSEAFKTLQRGDCYCKKELWGSAYDSYKYAIIESLPKIDRNIISGISYYKRLKLIVDGKIVAPLDTMRTYAREILNHLPQNDDFYAERTYANIILIEDGFNSLDSVDNWFSYFAFLSDVINKYTSRESLTDIDSINLQAALNLRSGWFLTWMRDTLSSINDLERAITVSTNPQWDSAFRIRLSNLYCELALSSEPDTIKVFPTGNALDYYKKSKEHFEKARVRNISALEISDIQPLYTYWRLDKDTVKLNVRDSIIADFCYKNPDWISYQNADYASLTTAVLLERSAYDSLFTFYDTIKNRFVFDHNILDNYLIGLICDGYSFDDVRKIGERLSAMGKDGKAHSARVKMFMGDFDGMFEDLLKNEKVFDSINDMAGEAFSYNIIAAMAGERLGYELAYQKCFSWATEGIDSTTMLCYSGKYKLKHAEEINDEIIKRGLKSSAEEDFRKVIADERTQRTKINTPYAYYWLERKDSARYWTEKLLQSDDTLMAYSVAADIHCLLRDYTLAKYYIDNYVQYIDSIAERTSNNEYKPFQIKSLKYDDNLESLSKYIDTVCAQYDSKEAFRHKKRIIFDMKEDTLDCFFKEGGSVYLTCKIGSVTDTLLFDPGAQYLQITQKFVCELMDKDSTAIKYSLGTEKFTASNASESEQEMVILSSITLGEITLHNVVAAIAEDPNAPMLLGMSVLGAFDIELSVRNSKITFKYIMEKLEKN